MKRLISPISAFMKFDRVLVAILILAAIFRFYRLFAFQYWSVDEEVFTAVVQQIAVGHKLLLVSPNVAIALSLGSFFHLLSAPIFWLARFQADQILVAGSALGVLTTLAVYKTGKGAGTAASRHCHGFTADFGAALNSRPRQEHHSRPVVRGKVHLH